MTLSDYAERLEGATVRGDGAVVVERIAALDDVDERALTFAVDERYLRQALESRAAAVLTEPALADAVGAARKPVLTWAAENGN